MRPFVLKGEEKKEIITSLSRHYIKYISETLLNNPAKLKILS